MAGGKLTPRQKMINLMYLVFIAMLAMNMSKEVLSAFGLLNEKFESTNTSALASNTQMLASLDAKASEAKGEFAIAATSAHKVEAITKDFYAYIGTLKTQVLEGVEVDPETGKLPYESMDKGESIDNWFTGEGYTAKGDEIIAKITKFKSDIKSALGTEKKYSTVIAELEKKFDVSDVANKEGLKDKYLAYNFKGFPSVASLAKLSSWQGDIKKAELDIYSAALGRASEKALSITNFQAVVALDKNVYFEGETVTGKVVIGKYDENTKPSGFSGPGKIVNGQAVISQSAGSVGEHDLGGKFTFIEDGKSIALPFTGKYVVVARPNSATISADKMNVVYRGVVNPITVSFAGVADNNVSASAPGMTKSSGVGKYNLSPGQGTELKINVNAKLPDGKTVSDAKTFRIKNIPGPVGTIGGDMGNTKGAKSRLQVSQIGAKLPDFDFEVGLQVVGFTLKVPGQAAVVVSGDRVNAQCASALARCTRGDQVTIFDIKTKVVGSPIVLPRTAPVIFEIL
jgi:gliding motility-associated protein GldM